jgi:hypothetical protein
MFVFRVICDGESPRWNAFADCSYVRRSCAVFKFLNCVDKTKILKRLHGLVDRPQAHFLGEIEWKMYQPADVNKWQKFIWMTSHIEDFSIHTVILIQSITLMYDTRLLPLAVAQIIHKQKGCVVVTWSRPILKSTLYTSPQKTFAHNNSTCGHSICQFRVIN